MNWETNENASCKFEKVLGSRKTCSFGVYQLWKKSIRRNSSQKFELTHPPFPHASWSHVPCRIVKRLKNRVLSKKWTENKAKVVLISVFLLFQTKMWRILTSAQQRWIRGKQPWTALKQLCFREKQLWNSTEQRWWSLKASDLRFPRENFWEKFKFCQNGIRSNFPGSVRSEVSRGKFAVLE